LERFFIRLDPPVAGAVAFAGEGGAGGGAGVGAGGGAGVGAGAFAGGAFAGAGGAAFPNPKSPDIEFNKLFDPADISVLS
jgi:hypothetical protein